MLAQSFYASTPEDARFDSGFEPHLILVFSNCERSCADVLSTRLSEQYPRAVLCGCSTAGSIMGNRVLDTGSAVHFLRFEKGSIRAEWMPIEAGLSEDAGQILASKLAAPELAHVLILSEGLDVNGTALVRGLASSLGTGVTITGGLAGDGDRFFETWVYDAQRKARSKVVCGIGFYGEDWEIGFGSMGGWSAFGIERLVTRSEGNVLYEIDGQPALQLYKSYLGERSDDLPSSGLLFPLSIRINADDRPVVRTILGIDETRQSLTFAGDIPQGSYAKLMNASVDRLLGGAENAAWTALNSLQTQPEWALLVSCVGRKLVLKQLVEEEVELVGSVLSVTQLSGFYSYGEIAPFERGLMCDLHNQTMTITTFRER
jgi:hypothetical protein